MWSLPVLMLPQGSESMASFKPTVKAFIQATRPRTFPLSVASIVCGSGLALSQLASTTGITWHNWLVLFLTIWVALALQILSNLANDYGDGVKGTDAMRDDSSPERMLARGQLQPDQFKRLIYIWAFLTFWSGVALIAIGFDNLHDFLIFLGLGVVAIIAAMGYTMGKRPYGYRAMGEVAVLIFFGWLGVLGSVYLQTQQLNLSHLVPATGCGGLAACVLYVNNMRDVYSDKQADKVTLAVLLGDKKMTQGYFFLLQFSMMCYLTYAAQFNLYALIIILLLPKLIRHSNVIYKSVALDNEGEVKYVDVIKIGGELKNIVMICLGVNVLFVCGLIISHFFSNA